MTTTKAPTRKVNKDVAEVSKQDVVELIPSYLPIAVSDAFR